jgi:putative PIN family toxin of toxin-antitoxin system
VNPPKAVLDTNVLISALLFEGECAKLVPLWKNGRFVYLLSKPILEEYVRALAYPKFRLTDKEVKALIEEDLLPFIETVKTVSHKKVIVPKLKDRDDKKFLTAAVVGEAEYLVTGDRWLLEIEKYQNVLILRPSDFLKIF